MCWRREPSPSSERLQGVYCAEGLEIAVGARGTILERRGGAWEVIDSGTEDNLYAVGGEGETVIAVGGNLRVGGDSLIAHRSGARWALEASGMQHVILALARGPGAWFVAGYNGSVLRGEPGRWSRLELTHFLHVFALCSAGDRVFVAGLGGTVLELGGGGELERVHEVEAQAHLRSLSAASREFVVAAGLGGTLVHYDGRRWKPMESPTQSHLEAIWVENPSSAWAVGHDGVVLHFDGVKWALVEAGVSENLYAVHGAGGQIVAVGAGGVICRLEQP